MVDMISYVLSGYEKNFFTEDELLDISKVEDKDKPKKQKMTLEQIESTLGFEIELIDSVPVKEQRAQRYKIATQQYRMVPYTITHGTVDQAKVTFKLFDNSEVELYYVYKIKNGTYIGRFFKSKVTSYYWDDYKRLFTNTSAVHTLKFCFGEED